MAFPQSFLISLILHAMVVGVAAGTLFFDRGNARERDLREREFVVVLEEKEDLIAEISENSECSEISEISEIPVPELPPPPADEILVPASTGESVPAEENSVPSETVPAPDSTPDSTRKEATLPASPIENLLNDKILNSDAGSVASSRAENPVPATSSGTDTTPATLHYRHRAVPAFPRAERLRGRTGTVILRLTLSPTGELLSVAVKQSSGSRAFDAAAISAARASTYVPAPNSTAPTTAEARYEFR